MSVRIRWILCRGLAAAALPVVTGLSVAEEPQATGDAANDVLGGVR